MIRSLSAVAAGVFVLTAAAAAFAAGGDLPAGPAHDTFVRVCSACHSPEVVMDKGFDRAGWDELVQTMIGRGAAATDAEAKEIVDYLAAARPPASVTSPPQP